MTPSKSPVLRLKTVARRGVDLLIEVAVFATALVEIPVFLLRRRKLFRNDLVYPFWIWSYGHTVAGIDYAARLSYPNRISLVYLSHPASNATVPLCFESNVDAFLLAPVLGVHGRRLDRSRFWVLRAILHIVCIFRSRLHIVDQAAVYRTVSLAPDAKFTGGVDDHSAPATNWTGYVRLLRDAIGRPPQLPAELDAKCRAVIRETNPGSLDRPLVALLLREKGQDGSLDNWFRSSGPQENYIPAVEHLVNSGYAVVGGAETDNRVFEGISGYYDLRHPDIEPSLLDVFVVASAALVITQQSGTHVLPNSFGIPCLLCDALPHRLGTFREDDLILFKHLRDRGAGRRLSLVEIYRDHPDLAAGFNFERKGIDIEPNTPEEIVEAVREMLERLEGRFADDPRDDALALAFRRLPSSSMTIAVQGNRPPLAVLRPIEAELLAAVEAPVAQRST